MSAETAMKLIVNYSFEILKDETCYGKVYTNMRYEQGVVIEDMDGDETCFDLKAAKLVYQALGETIEHLEKQK